MYRDAIIDMHRELAGIRKAAFDANIEAGFTEAQALQLVRDID